MGNTEYIAAFQNVVLPVAYSFAPEFVIVSAGFDAGINDPLGGYLVSPETFGHLIQMLKGLAGGRMILALEGGYNLTTTSYAFGICMKTLLGDPVMMPKNVYRKFSLEAIKSIRSVINHLKQYYHVFDIFRKLSAVPYLVKNISPFTSDCYTKQLIRQLDSCMLDHSDAVEHDMRRFSERQVDKVNH